MLRWTAAALLVIAGLMAVIAAQPARRTSSSEPVVYGPYPHPAGARDSDLPEAERVAREIIRSDRTIASAEGRVERSKSEKARADIASARQRQTDAKAALQQTFYARANRLTLEARAFAKSALTKVGPVERDPEAVARALEQTDDALHRASEVLQDGATAAQRRRYRELKAGQDEARRTYASGRLPSAYAETRRVRDGVLELLRLCADLPVSKETARRALRRAERAMERARGDLAAPISDAAARLKRDARLQMQKARAGYARANYRDALLHAKLVERSLERAVDAQRLATSRTG